VPIATPARAASTSRGSGTPTPTHPARPSQFDADRAWLDYVYIICRTTGAGAEDMNAFALEAEGGAMPQIDLDISPVPGGGK